MATDGKTLECGKCGKLLKKRSRPSAYCADCHATALKCGYCDTPIAAHNKRRVCGDCRKLHGARTVPEGFDWWEDR